MFQQVELSHGAGMRCTRNPQSNSSLFLRQAWSETRRCCLGSLRARLPGRGGRAQLGDAYGRVEEPYAVQR